MQEEIRLIARDTASDQEGVRFFVTPEFNESSSISYTEIYDIRQPAGYLIYIGTASRTYQLTARMVSRTNEEADLTYRYTHLLKSWTVPRKEGNSGGGGLGGSGDNAPEILKLYGYGIGAKGQIRGVPVVITSLNIEYPSSVAYIKTSNEKALVPIIQTFSISLKEAHSPTEIEEFDLGKFKQGILNHW